MITGRKRTVKLARKLRSEMSLPKVKLWQALRQRPNDHKFRRQHPAGISVLDFFCAKARLDIEIDGSSHAAAAVIAKDQARSRFLRAQGIATTGIPAKLVLEDLDSVVTRIVQICDERIMKRTPPLHHLAGGPPPLVGED